MGVHISDLKMPKRMPIKAIIYPDGRVIVTLHSGKILERKVVSLPPHGRLIDAEKLSEHKFVGVVGKSEAASYMVGWNAAIEAIQENAPTILPADKEKTA